MAVHRALLLLLLPFRWVTAAVLSTEKERPVMKVVRLLQDMSVELQKELDDDKAVHEMLGCWCKTNEEEKTKAIELGTAKAAQLQASMDENTAKIVEMKEKRKSTLDEVNSDHAALTKADELRLKESKAFQGEETDLIEAIKAAKQAIVVLSKHNPEFSQLRAVARQLQDSKLVLASKGLRQEQAALLKGFLQQAGSGTVSFLSIPGFQSYAPQSGQIFGILKQMQEDFESSLSEAQKSEEKSRADYKKLKAAKQEEIAAGKASIVQFDADIADTSEKAAQEAQEIEDTNEQLAMDQAFLADLKSKCAESEEEFETRTKARMDEIVAVQDTIKILNADESFDVFDKSVNTAFLQTSSSSTEKSRRERASFVLQRAADVSKAPKLALLAMSAKLDAFVKVKEEIDKLVVELGKQQEDEVEQRDLCIEEFASNDRATAKADDKKSSLQTKIADLGKTIETLTADIDAAKSAIADMETQMKRASENREAESGDYQQTLADQRLTQTILTKAVNRMKEVYAFLQQQPGAAHIATSGTHTDAGNGPARFTKYEQNAGGARVVALLETIMADSKKMEEDAIVAEEDSQTAYENFMKESNKSITKYSESITHMSEARAKAKASLSLSESDLKQTVEELGGLSEMAADLHKSCDFVLKNFDARQAARAAEMDALKEAKGILSGMK
jgi:hypothetical protein